MIFKNNLILVNSDDNTIFPDFESDKSEFIPLMSLIPLVDEVLLSEILKEYQIFNWSRRTEFCGACGALTDIDEKDGAMVCPNCKERFYPAQFPAVIVSIVKDDKILLAHNANFPGNMYSVLAGFVDLGESLEETVRREIREEVGLEVKNIEYFGSQNWGFTTSLMIAFKAEYESGEICIDNLEIDHADWYDSSNLPEIPPKLSIARTLIDDFIKKDSIVRA